MKKFRVVFYLLFVLMAVFFFQSALHSHKKTSPVINKVPEKPPRQLLLDTVALITIPKDKHLDALVVGTGMESEIQYLLKQGWHVVVVEEDRNAILALKHSLNLNKSSSIKFIHQKLDKLKPRTLGCFDLLVSYHYLPFLGGKLNTSWYEIKKLVKPDGYLSLTLFGPKLKWPKMENIKTLDKDEIYKMLSDFKVLYFDEEFNSSDHLGDQTITHIYKVIAHKEEKKPTTDKPHSLLPSIL